MLSVRLGTSCVSFISYDRFPKVGIRISNILKLLDLLKCTLGVNSQDFETQMKKSRDQFSSLPC